MAGKVGVETVCQLVPSKCIAIGWLVSAGFHQIPTEPTAQTSSAATAETSLRRLLMGLGLGLGTTVQPWPSKWRVSVSKETSPSTSLDWPTAHTSSVVIASTAMSQLPNWPEFGLGTVVHCCPS